MRKAIGGFLLLAALISPTWAEPVGYHVDPAHSSIVFSVRHMVTQFEGRFRTFDGSIDYDKGDVKNSKVDFKVDAASIFTDNDRRDGHLKSPDFLDVAKFPALEFHSKKITPNGDSKFDVVGEMTIHGVTKPMMVSVTRLGSAKGPQGEVVGFQGEFTLNRKDYGVVWNKTIEGTAMLGDDVTVRVLVEADPKK